MDQINYTSYFWQNSLVRLRAIREEDWEGEYRNRFDSYARLLLESEIELPPVPEEIRDATRSIQNFDMQSGRLFFSIETLDGIWVGGANLNGMDERNGVFSIGMQIDRPMRAKGYGTSAMQILLRYAFGERRLHKFNGAVLQGNKASCEMLRKLGCRQEGIRREVAFSNGVYLDEILFGLTAEEFLQRPMMQT